MKKQLEQRLKSLKTEFESGKQAMQELETKQANLRDTLLRISGAIQVLEEELAEAEESNDQLPIEVESLAITNSHES
ncbi:hypothetical protein [Nostoc sp. ChiQUE01b]|uniref:hypothetical protein n=1 Tax=Nostoc sp. ChiQUE01b TaxID=3075376 RepID=UPI002AD27A39|nr:hypothetical protein [Nostoc sp. ChiQUE01b]MDZ8263319.1 hypothetical protein [Nostoc sp. ChiQUE01b]